MLKSVVPHNPKFTTRACIKQSVSSQGKPASYTTITLHICNAICANCRSLYSIMGGQEQKQSKLETNKVAMETGSYMFHRCLEAGSLEIYKDG